MTLPEQQAEWDRQFAEINAAMKAVPPQAPLWTVPVAALVIAGCIMVWTLVVTAFGG